MGTAWTAPEIWLRRGFDLEVGEGGAVVLNDPRLMANHDDSAELYLNGVLAASLPIYSSDKYDAAPISQEARAALRPGRNLLAVHCTQVAGPQFIDVGIIESLLPLHSTTTPAGASASPAKQFTAPPEANRLAPDQEALLALHASAGTIDVLPLIDPARDARSGNWTADVEGLHSPAGTSFAVLRLPLTVPNEYCLTIVAQRAKGWTGGSILNIGQVAAGKQFNSTIDANGTTGIELIDDKPGWKNESTVNCGNLFKGGRPSVLTYIVRQTGVQISFDGKQVLDWRSGFRRFSLRDEWRLPVHAPLRLFLGTHCDWHFKAIQLTPLTDEKSASADAQQPRMNLLKTIDLKKHARGGWALDGSVLVSPPNVSHAGVRFPGVVPDEYRLRIVAERPRGFQGPPPLHVGLVTRLSQATLVLDADHKSGLEAVDGKMYHENATTFPGDLFIDGVESTIDCTVDRESIRVDFDGHTIIDWRGDLRQLAPTWSEFGAPKRTFWIGTHCNWRIKKMELLPLTKE